MLGRVVVDVFVYAKHVWCMLHGFHAWFMLHGVCMFHGCSFISIHPPWLYKLTYDTMDSIHRMKPSRVQRCRVSWALSQFFMNSSSPGRTQDSGGHLEPVCWGASISQDSWKFVRYMICLQVQPDHSSQEHNHQHWQHVCTTCYHSVGPAVVGHGSIPTLAVQSGTLDSRMLFILFLSCWPTDAMWKEKGA